MAVVARNRSSIASSGKRFCLITNGQTALGAQLASSSMGNRLFLGGQSGRGVKLTTHLSLVPMLRMNGAILLLPSWRAQGLYRYHFLEIERLLTGR